MCTREQQENALAMYDATQSIAEVIRRLGYPSKQALYTWIANRDKPWQKPNGFRGATVQLARFDCSVQIGQGVQLGRYIQIPQYHLLMK